MLMTTLTCQHALTKYLTLSISPCLTAWNMLNVGGLNMVHCRRKCKLLTMITSWRYDLPCNVRVRAYRFKILGANCCKAGFVVQRLRPARLTNVPLWF